MRLARGDINIRVAADDPAPPVVDVGSFVVAVAGDPEERMRIAGALDDTPLLLVSRPEEALALLGDIAAAGDDQSALRHQVHERSDADTGVVAGLVIDSDARLARWGGNRVGLTPLEHDLLHCLMTEAGHILTFDRLQETVWHNDHLGGRSHVQSVVKRLRRKLRQLQSPLRIDAVRGVGLRLVARAAPPEPDVDDVTGDLSG